MTSPVNCIWCGDRPGGCILCPSPEAARAEGERRRNAGMDRVSRHDAWLARANEWVVCLPHGTRFDAGDLIRNVGRPDRPNETGAAFATWAKLRLIVPVGWVQASNIASNASQIQVWYRL